MFNCSWDSGQLSCLKRLTKHSIKHTRSDIFNKTCKSLSAILRLIQSRRSSTIHQQLLQYDNNTHTHKKNKGILTWGGCEGRICGVCLGWWGGRRRGSQPSGSSRSRRLWLPLGLLWWRLRRLVRSGGGGEPKSDPRPKGSEFRPNRDLRL